MNIFLKDYIPQTEGKNKITVPFFVHVQKLEAFEKGQLLALISVQTQDQLDSANIARFVWNGISEEYRYFEASPLESLKSALASGENQLKKLIHKSKEGEDHGVELDFVILAIVGDELYFAKFGGNDLLILHEGSIVDISEMMDENKVTAGSVIVGEQDLILTSSPRTLSKIEQYLEPQSSTVDFLKKVDGIISGIVPKGEGLILLSTGIDFNGVLAGDVRPEDTVIKEVAKSESESTSHKVEVIDELVNVKEEEGEILSDPPAQNIEPTLQDDIEEEKVVSPTVFMGGGRTAQVKLLLFLKQVWKTLQKMGSMLWTKLSAGIKRLSGDSLMRKAWFKRVQAKFSQMRFGSTSPRGIRLGAYRERSIRIKRLALLIVAVVIIAALLFGIEAAKNRREANQIHAQYESFYNEVNKTLTEAEESIKSEPEDSETALFSAKEKIDQFNAKKLALNSEDQNSLTSLQNKLNTLNDTLNRITPLVESSGNVEIFLDSRIELGEKAQLHDLTIHRDDQGVESLFLVDSGGNSLYKVTLSGKEINKVADPSSLIKAPAFVDVGNSGVYLYDKESGVLVSKFQGDRSRQSNIAKVSGLGPEAFDSELVSEFAIFTAADSVYVLQNSSGEILKAQGNNGSYGLPFRYIQDDRLKESTDFFADLSIYTVGKGIPGLYRFTFSSSTGSLTENPISVTGSRTEFEGISKGFTYSSTDQKIVLFDQKLKRVLLFEKPDEAKGRHPGEAVLVAQYEYRGERESVWEDVKDVVVDFNEDFAYILDGSRVWKVDL